MELPSTLFLIYEHYDFPLQLTGLPFLTMVIGFLVAIALNQPLVRLVIRVPLPGVLQPEGTDPNSPEARLKLSLFSCVLMPVSLLWFAWTSGGEVHWIIPTLAGLPFGFAAITIFFVFLTYTAETYTVYANSANVCNTFCRSLITSIFPLVANSLLKSLGTKWGVSLFAFLSLGFIPVPPIFLRYGASIRARSRYGQEAARMVAQMRSGFVSHSPYNQNHPRVQDGNEQPRREIHVTLSVASMHTGATAFSDSGMLVECGLKSGSGVIPRDPMVSKNDTLDLAMMDASAAEFPVPPLR